MELASTTHRTWKRSGMSIGSTINFSALSLTDANLIQWLSHRPT